MEQLQVVGLWIATDSDGARALRLQVADGRFFYVGPAEPEESEDTSDDDSTPVNPVP